MPAAEDDTMALVVRQFTNLSRPNKERTGHNLLIKKGTIQIDRLVNLRRRVKDQLSLAFKRHQQLLLIRLRQTMKSESEIGQTDQLRLSRISPLQILTRLELQKERIPEKSLLRPSLPFSGLLIYYIAHPPVTKRVDHFMRQDETVCELGYFAFHNLYNTRNVMAQF